MRSILLIIILLLINIQSYAKTCTYEYRIWNRLKGRSEKKVKVKKDYKSLTENEKGPLGCTPCQEDQKLVTLSNGVSFKVCKKKADEIQAVLEASLADGFPIRNVLGYRPQMSKGKLDPEGYRTELSFHSYGVAIDINRENNGLYDQCIHWAKDCRLIQGGAYRPEHPLSIKEDSLLVSIMGEIGLKWGGQIRGKQKDFMHFSPSGY